MRYLVILISVFFLSATTQQSDTKNFTDDASGLSIDYPSGWSLVDNSQTIVVIGAPINSIDKVRANLNVVSEKLSFDLTPLEYANAAKTQMGPMLKDFKSAEVEERTLGSKKFGFMRFYHSPGGNEILAHQYYYIQDRTVYVITCTMDPNREGVFDPIFQDMVSTFNIK